MSLNQLSEIDILVEKSNDSVKNICNKDSLWSIIQQLDIKDFLQDKCLFEKLYMSIEKYNLNPTKEPYRSNHYFFKKKLRRYIESHFDEIVGNSNSEIEKEISKKGTFWNITFSIEAIDWDALWYNFLWIQIKWLEWLEIHFVDNLEPHFRKTS